MPMRFDGAVLDVYNTGGLPQRIFGIFLRENKITFDLLYDPGTTSPVNQFTRQELVFDCTDLVGFASDINNGFSPSQGSYCLITLCKLNAQNKLIKIFFVGAISAGSIKNQLIFLPTVNKTINLNKIYRRNDFVADVNYFVFQNNSVGGFNCVSAFCNYTTPAGSTTLTIKVSFAGETVAEHLLSVDSFNINPNTNYKINIIANEGVNGVFGDTIVLFNKRMYDLLFPSFRVELKPDIGGSTPSNPIWFFDKYNFELGNY